MKYLIALIALCFSCAPSDGCRSWERGEVAYIWIDDPQELFSEDQVRFIRESADSWEEALGGFITFEFVEGKGPQNLIVIRPERRSVLNEDHGLDAVTCYVPWELGGDITMPYDDVNEWGFRVILLHEMGHALGLDHDSNENTMMFHSVNPGRVDRITCGDVTQFCEYNDCNPNELPACSEQDDSTSSIK